MAIIANVLEKSPGAVACNHCQGIGADTICAFCQRPVCRSCLSSDRCPVPHPHSYRLGTGWRLRYIDDSARFGLVEQLFGGQTQLWRLDTLQKIELPWQAAGVDLLYRGVPAIKGDQLYWTCATAIRHRDSGGEEVIEYVDARVMVATLTLEGIGRERFLRRPERWGEEGKRLLVSSDARRAVIVADDGIDVIDLVSEEAVKRIDLQQVIHSVAVSPELEDPLIALGLFGKIIVLRLEDGEELGRYKVDNNDVCCLAFGRDRLMLMTDDSRSLYTLEVDRTRAVRKWRQLERRRIRGLMAVLSDEADISPDGKLQAVRRRRKDVAVLKEDGTQQVLGQHTDRVCLVRFVGNGSRLVTADRDNRVFYWPRVDDRIVTG